MQSATCARAPHAELHRRECLALRSCVRPSERLRGPVTKARRSQEQCCTIIVTSKRRAVVSFKSFEMHNRRNNMLFHVRGYASLTCQSFVFEPGTRRLNNDFAVTTIHTQCLLHMILGVREQRVGIAWLENGIKFSIRVP